MKNNYGFTLIELLVVISILTIISATTISSMNSNFDKQSILSEASGLSHLLDTLDDKIGTEITDYTVFVPLGDLYYYSLNENYKDIKQYYIPGGTYTGKIITNDSKAENMNVDTFINEKKINSISFSSTGSLGNTFYSGANYTVKGYINNNELNELHINYYTNIDYKRIIHLNQITDSNGNTFNSILIKNSIGNTRKYYTQDNHLIPIPLGLIFDLNDKNATLTLQ